MAKPATRSPHSVGPKGEAKAGRVMREFSAGNLRSGSKEGPKVAKPAQAKAIAMSEARRVSRGEKGRW